MNNNSIAVEPQVFNLIVYLLENKDKVISRGEILDNVWQGRIVSDTSINNHIKSARKVLGDDGAKQEIIKTIRTRGYQFVSEIEEVTKKVTELGIGNANKKHPILIITLLTMVSALLVFLWQQNNTPITAQHQVKSELTQIKQVSAQQIIAVLPFANTKPDVDSDYLGFALANQIIGNLAYLDQFTIRPAGSIRKYVNQVIDPISVGRSLKVDFILNGNYLKENNIIRLNIELIKVITNETLWLESIEVDYSDTFSLQDLVAKRVATGLNASFTSKGINRKYKDIPNSALAYEYFLRGLSYPFSNQGHKMAVEMLEKSIELDPNYAPSYAHLGNHKRLMEQHGKITPSGSLDHEWYYKKALELNPDLLEALNNLAALYTETNRIEEALVVTRKMLSINPNSANSHFSLGYIYRYAGMLDEAIQEMEIALKISPDNTRFRSIVATYVSAGKYNQALKYTYLDKGDYGVGYSGIIAYNQENYQLAFKHFDKVLAIDPHGVWGLIAQFYIALIDGDKAQGLIALTRIVDTNIEDAENIYYAADFYALLDEQELSLKMLEKAIDTGYFNYPSISQNPSFNSFINNPKFIQLLKKAKQRHDVFREKFL